MCIVRYPVVDDGFVGTREYLALDESKTAAHCFETCRLNTPDHREAAPDLGLGNDGGSDLYAIDLLDLGHHLYRQHGRIHTDNVGGLPILKDDLTTRTGNPASRIGNRTVGQTDE